MRASTLRLLEARHTAAGAAVWVDLSFAPRRVRARVVGASVAVLLLAAGLLIAPPAGDRGGHATVPVMVSNGDTLWQLARRHAGPDAYLPEVIHEIRQINHLRTSDVRPGQRLLIPVHAPAPTDWGPEPVLARSR